MYILIDYSNIPDEYQNDKAKILDFIDGLYSQIRPYISADDNSLYFRLYGGWYNGDSLSKDAEALEKAILSRDNPFIIERTEYRRFLKVHTALALSLISNKTKNLFFTYREKKLPRNIKSFDPENKLCNNPNCEALTLLRFWDKNYKTPCCNRKVQDLLFKGEQKLVDSMIVSDAIFLTLRENLSQIIIVSSDDDIWPAIETIVSCQKQVFHFHCISSHTERCHYEVGLDKKHYMQFSI